MFLQHMFVFCDAIICIVYMCSNCSYATWRSHILQCNTMQNVCFKCFTCSFKLHSRNFGQAFFSTETYNVHIEHLNCPWPTSFTYSLQDCSHHQQYSQNECSTCHKLNVSNTNESPYYAIQLHLAICLILCSLPFFLFPLSLFICLFAFQ